MKWKEIHKEYFNSKFTILDKIRQLRDKKLLEERNLFYEDTCYHFYYEAVEDIENNNLDNIRSTFDKLEENYKFRPDRPHDSITGQKHIHVFLKNKELFSINQNGSSHHRKNKGLEISKSLQKQLKDKFPDFKINNIIEDFDRNSLMLFEFINS